MKTKKELTLKGKLNALDAIEGELIDAEINQDHNAFMCNAAFNVGIINNGIISEFEFIFPEMYNYLISNTLPNSNCIGECNDYETRYKVIRKLRKQLIKKGK
jgi:hypothetical protein